MVPCIRYVPWYGTFGTYVRSTRVPWYYCNSRFRHNVLCTYTCTYTCTYVRTYVRTCILCLNYSRRVHVSMQFWVLEYRVYVYHGTVRTRIHTHTHSLHTRTHARRTHTCTHARTRNITFTPTSDGHDDSAMNDGPLPSRRTCCRCYHGFYRMHACPGQCPSTPHQNCHELPHHPTNQHQLPHSSL